MELELKKITRRFGEKTAVKDVNLVFRPGIYGLLGENGSGKTTLMRMICGILEPSSGEIFCDGENITKMGEKYRDKLGYLPQDLGYYPDFTARDFMYYMAALKGIEKKKAREKTRELFEQMNLSDVAKKKIRTFSGGMRQRLGIAQALLNEPDILILDEPTAGLDPKERAKFRNIVEKYSMGKIVILSTHIVSDIDHIADIVLMMKRGEFVLDIPLEQAAMQMNGKVWNIVMDVAKSEKVAEKYRVVDIQNRIDGKVSVRIISDKKPEKEAKLVHPNLEDLYLYHFQEVGKGV